MAMFLGSKLKVGTIIVRNVTLDKYDHLLAGEIGTLLDHALDNAYVGMFDFWAPIESGTLNMISSFNQLKLTPLRRIQPCHWETVILTELACEGFTSVKHRRLYNENIGQRPRKALRMNSSLS